MAGPTKGRKVRSSSRICLLLFVALLAVTCDAGKPDQSRRIPCPDVCQCDIKDSLRRANCSGHKLISIEANIPKQTEVLHLSSNIISKLEKHTFQSNKLTNLQYLNLSTNIISVIHYNAFHGMSKLKVLDLSNNVLTYIHGQWFRDMSTIESIYLHHNKIQSLENDENGVNIFESSTLKVLNIADSKIAYVEDGIFNGLPALEILDLSNNFLITMGVGKLTGLKNLDRLMLAGNEVGCDNNLKLYCDDRNILLDLNDVLGWCKSDVNDDVEIVVASPSRERSQKMAIEIQGNKSGDFQEPVELEKEDKYNGWSIGNHKEVEDSSNTFAPAVPAQKTIYGYDLCGASPLLTVGVPLLIGLVVGIVAGVTVTYTCIETRRLVYRDILVQQRRRRRKREVVGDAAMTASVPLKVRAGTFDDYSAHVPIMECVEGFSETTPVTPRKQYNQTSMYGISSFFESLP